MRLEKFQQAVDAVKKRLELQLPTIGVYIRRGDKHVETPYVPLAVSMERVRRVSKRTGIRRVFVTSDAEGIFAEFIDPYYSYADAPPILWPRILLVETPRRLWRRTKAALRPWRQRWRTRHRAGRNGG